MGVAMTAERQSGSDSEISAMDSPIRLRQVIDVSTRLRRMAAECYALIEQLYPICRSITGNGLRQSLRLLQETIPRTGHEVPSGTHVFDWHCPKEWNIRDAYIKNSAGDKVVDFQECNLHVVNYSIPIDRKVSLAEFRQHLFSLPESPDWIPYRTSYYKETWGLLFSHRQLEALSDEEYEVRIDSTLEPGHLDIWRAARYREPLMPKF